MASASGSARSNNVQPLLTNTVRTGSEHLAAPATFQLETLRRTHRRLGIAQLGVHKVHRGCYVIMRVCSVQMKLTALFANLQDPQGDTIRFGIYNYVSPLAFYGGDASWTLRPGTNLIVLEPFVKVGQDAVVFIRCDNPSHVIWLDELPQDQASGILSTVDWRVPIPRPSFWLSAFAPLGEPEECKAIGNEHFKLCDYSEAAKWYSKAIHQLHSERDTKPPPVPASSRKLLLTLLSNRSETWLKMFHYRLALRDANRALELDTEHIKSIYRKARAQLALSMVMVAQATVDHGLRLDPRNITMKDLDRDTSRRLHALDSAEEIDITGMLETVRKHNHAEVALLWPDYKGAIDIRDTCTDRGRAVFAGQEISAGQILLVEKALQIVFPGELQSTAELGAGIKTDDLKTAEFFARAGKSQLTWRLVDACCSSRRVHAAVETLYEGCQLTGWRTKESASHATELDKLPVGERRAPQVVDIGHIEAVATNYSHNLQNISVAKTKAMAEHTYSDTALGLWYHLGFMNHSCTPNCTVTLIGDMVLVSATQRIGKGEELTISYAPLTDMERDVKLKRYGITCSCTLCAIDPKLDRRLRACGQRLLKVMCKLLQSKRTTKDRKDAISKLVPLEQELCKVRSSCIGLYTKVCQQLGEQHHTIGEHSKAVAFVEMLLDSLKLGPADDNLHACAETALQLWRLSIAFRSLGDQSKAVKYARMAQDCGHKALGNSAALVSYLFDVGEHHRSP
eukprot:scpid44857/ scgid13017/ Protein STIP1 homolog